MKATKTFVIILVVAVVILSIIAYATLRINQSPTPSPVALGLPTLLPSQQPTKTNGQKKLITNECGIDVTLDCCGYHVRVGEPGAFNTGRRLRYPKQCAVMDVACTDSPAKFAKGVKLVDGACVLETESNSVVDCKNGYGDINFCLSKLAIIQKDSGICDESDDNYKESCHTGLARTLSDFRYCSSDLCLQNYALDHDAIHACDPHSNRDGCINYVATRLHKVEYCKLITAPAERPELGVENCLREIAYKTKDKNICDGLKIYKESCYSALESGNR